MPAHMTLELLFDVTLNKSGDILNDTNALFHAMEPQNGKPAVITFKWGSTKSFPAYLASLEVQYVLFRSDGSPVRAWARMTLVQAAVETTRFNPYALQAGQNPTTQAEEAGRTWTLRQGDSLPSIAWECYGDQNAWRAIARANAIDDPLRLRRGSVLTIPELDA
jgi:hypothetical protein